MQQMPVFSEWFHWLLIACELFLMLSFNAAIQCNDDFFSTNIKVFFRFCVCFLFNLATCWNLPEVFCNNIKEILENI